MIREHIIYNQSASGLKILMEQRRFGRSKFGIKYVWVFKNT